MSSRGGLETRQNTNRPGSAGEQGSSSVGQVPPTAPPLPPHSAGPVVPPVPPDPPPSQGNPRSEDRNAEQIYANVAEDKNDGETAKDEDDDATAEEIQNKYCKMNVQSQQLLLDKLKMTTAQNLYPTAKISEMQSDAETVLEDTEEEANRIHKKMELRNSKIKDFDSLETVYKLRAAEKEKQVKDVDDLGRTRKKETRVVKAIDTFERVKDGRISDPEEIANRIENPGEFQVDYAIVQRPKSKKGKKVRLMDAKQQTESESDEEFFESQESFTSEAEVPAKTTKRTKKKAVKQVPTSKTNKKPIAKKEKERPPSDPSSSSSDESSSSSDSDDPEDEEEESDDEEDETSQDDSSSEKGLSLVKLANEKYNKKLQRTLMQVERLLKRAKENRKRKDKATLEKVKTELAAAMTLLDRVAVDEKNGTTKQWTEVERSYTKVSEAQEENLNKLKDLEADSQRRAQLPKATLETWDGKSSTLQSWILHLRKTLTFQDELLNVATLKKQVAESKEKKKILRRLQYCKTLDQCFSRLQKFYGSFDVALPDLKAKLEALPDEPEEEVTESENIEELLYFIDQMKAHKKSKKIVNQLFINQFLHKLTKDRAKEISDKKIGTCKKFEKILEEILESNQHSNLVDNQSEVHP